MAKQTPMDREAADRTARAAQENPESKTAQDDFPSRASAAADRNEQDDRDAPPETADRGGSGKHRAPGGMCPVRSVRFSRC